MTSETIAAESAGEVLLSAVGTADPITADGDGPILHIVRHCQPNQVHLIATPDFLPRAEQVKQAISFLNPEVAVEIEAVELPPHEYLWIDPVRKLLQRVAEAKPGTRILVNVSSGTPAISSAFVALHAFGVPAVTALQVAAPGNKANRDQSLPLAEMWELNPDNEPDAPTRVLEVPADHLAVLMQRENVKQHLLAADYPAALRLAPSAALPESLVGDIQRWDRRTSMGDPVDSPTRASKLAIMALQAAAIRQDYRSLVLLAEVAIIAIIEKQMVDLGIWNEVQQSSRKYPTDEHASLGGLLMNQAVINALGKDNTNRIRDFKKVRNPVAHDVKPLSPKSRSKAEDLLARLEKLAGVSPNLVRSANSAMIAEIDKAPLG